jgi:CBS domain-containing protein
VSPDTPVSEIAELLLQCRISGVPVVAEVRRVVGLVSEGDLMRRPETGAQPRRSWWLAALVGEDGPDKSFVRAHGRFARDVMSSPAHVISENAPIADVAELLEERRIKRVSVVREGCLVGIVSRADLLRGFATRKPLQAAETHSDGAALRRAIQDEMARHAWPNANMVNVLVADGDAHLWGVLGDREERRALQVLVENVPGVKSVTDHRTKLMPGV